MRLELEGESKVPAGMITPILRYKDPKRASEWLKAAFGFEVARTVADTDQHQQHIVLGYGSQVVLIYPASGSLLDDFMGQPEDVGGVTTHLCYIDVDDIDTHFGRASKAGARIVVPLNDEVEDDNARFYMCRDPEGYLWSFGTVIHAAPRTASVGGIVRGGAADESSPVSASVQTTQPPLSLPELQVGGKFGQMLGALSVRANPQIAGMSLVAGVCALVIGVASLIGAFFTERSDDGVEERIKSAVGMARQEGVEEVRVVRSRLGAELTTVSNKLQTLKARQTSSNKALADARRLLSERTAALKKTREDAERVRAELRDANNQLQLSGKKLKAARAGTLEANHRLERQSKAVKALRASSAKLATKIKQLKAKLATSSNALRAQQESAEKKSSFVVKLERELEQVKAQGAAFKARTKAREGKVAALTTELADANARIRGLRAKIKELEPKVLRYTRLERESRKRLQRDASARQRAEAKVQALRKTIADQKIETAKVLVRVKALQAKNAAIAAALKSSEAARKRLLSENGAARQFTPIGVARKVSASSVAPKVFTKLRDVRRASLKLEQRLVPRTKARALARASARNAQIRSDDSALATLSHLKVVVISAARKIEALDKQVKAERKRASAASKPVSVAAVSKPFGAQAKPPPDSLFETPCGRSAWNRVMQKFNRPRKAMRGLAARLCSAAKTSAEPAKCLHAVMTGALSWGPSKKWPLSNAVNLCSGSQNAGTTLSCFRRELAALKSWRRAIEQCTAYQ